MSVIMKHAAIMRTPSPIHGDKHIFSSDPKIIGQQFEIKVHDESRGRFNEIGTYSVRNINAISKTGSRDAGKIEIAAKPFNKQANMNMLNLDIWNWAKALSDFVVFDSDVAEQNKISYSSSVALLTDPFQNVSAQSLLDVFRDRY
ncbi:MAG: hypothetical protein KGH49_02990 [Candidatus Micrarchaeota archaeon]|nr:hypothetical protein [Candidatus Micrarchaeota archaeon]